MVAGHGARPLHPHPPRHHYGRDPGAGDGEGEEPPDDHGRGRHLHHLRVGNTQLLHSTGLITDNINKTMQHANIFAICSFKGVNRAVS